MSPFPWLIEAAAAGREGSFASLFAASFRRGWMTVGLSLWLSRGLSGL